MVNAATSQRLRRTCTQRPSLPVAKPVLERRPTPSTYPSAVVIRGISSNHPKQSSSSRNVHPGRAPGRAPGPPPPLPRVSASHPHPHPPQAASPTPANKGALLLLPPPQGHLPLRRRHMPLPALRVGILGQHTSRARFSHLAAVDVRDHVAFTTLECRGDAVLAPRPAFHELLLAALNQPQPSEPSSSPSYSSAPTPHLLSFPDPPRLPEGQEDAIPFRNTIISFAIKTVWNELGPSLLRAVKAVPWHGAPIDLRLPHTSRARLVDIPPETVASLLKACRAHAASLTALLHALALASLARRLPAPQAASFAASTPISLRPYFGPGADA
ncbi:Uncharacterized protein TPAR_03861, partial [Tolypocladium paradoxum]